MQNEMILYFYLGFAKSIVTPFFSHENSTRGTPSAWHTTSAVVVPSPLLATFLHWAPFWSFGLTLQDKTGMKVIIQKSSLHTVFNANYKACALPQIRFYSMYVWHTWHEMMWYYTLRTNPTNSHWTISCTSTLAGGAMPLSTVHW